MLRRLLPPKPEPMSGHLLGRFVGSAACAAALTGCVAAPGGVAASAAFSRLDAVPGDYRISAALGDVDGDGVEDLLVSRNGDMELFAGLSASPRRFAAAALPLGHPLTPTCESAVEPRLVDWDGDGDLDLLSLHGGDPPGLGGAVTVVWRANDGAGQFGAPEVVCGADGAPLALAGEPSAVARVDWDGDGRADLLVSTPALHVFAGTEYGLATRPHALGVASRSFAVVDWDGDGDLDVVAQERDALVLVRRTRRGLAAPQVLERVAEHDPPLRLSVCDWDGDGRAELLVGGQVRDDAAPLAAEQRHVIETRLATARRVTVAIDALRDELNRSKPPIGDPAAMARRQQRRSNLRAWADGPRAEAARLQARLRAADSPTLRGVLRVVRP